MESHSNNALKVVEYLNNHAQVESVSHPSVSTDPNQQELYKKHFLMEEAISSRLTLRGMHKKLKIL